MTTTTINLREEIVTEVLARNSDRLTSLGQELAFHLAVRSSMKELDGKSVTRRICGKVAEILGWQNATIVLNASDHAFVSWTITAWGGESHRKHDNRLTAWLGSREGMYSPKCVNFEGWEANSCGVQRTLNAIAEHKSVTREGAEALADALIAVREAKARYAAIAEGSPVSSYAEEALNSLT